MARTYSVKLSPAGTRDVFLFRILARSQGEANRAAKTLAERGDMSKARKIGTLDDFK